MSLGTPRLITLHWTAGDHFKTFSSYHFCVQGNGRVVNSLSLKKKGSHTWGRNTGNIGVAMCAMLNTSTMPTSPQIESVAALVADLSIQFKISLTEVYRTQRHKVIQGTRIPTGETVEVPFVTDHAAYARCDGYYPDRWDCGRYTADIIKKALWYRGEILAGRRMSETWPV